MKFNFDLENRNVLSYLEYRVLMSEKTASGENELYAKYGTLNDARMRRLEKTYEPSDEIIDKISAIGPHSWIVLTEGWCGDAAQNLPQLAAIASKVDGVNLQILLRDENLDIMDAFLTNGGRAIPKLIAIDPQNDVLFEWGPRPSEIQKLFQYLKNAGMSKEDYNLKLQKKYAQEKGKQLESDLLFTIEKLQDMS